MRTDLKIGVVVGLLVATVAVIWIAVRTEPKETKPAAETPPPPATPIVTLRDSADVLPVQTPPAPATPPETPPVATTEPVAATPPPSDRITIDSLVVTPPAPPAAEHPAVTPPATPPVAPVEDISRQPRVTPDVPEVLQPDVREPARAAVAPAVADASAAGSTAPRTYVVASGDNGFWSVAKKMYGDGKYMDVIAKANPQIDPESLRPGQKLTIPPLPAPVSPAGGLGTPAAGASEVAALPGGQRTYVVKEGDAGFWGVSVAVYGHGKYYKTIEKANPGVKSDSLSVGTKLIVPPKPEEQPAIAAAAASAAAGAAAPLPSNYRTYTVADGDAGFWDVAVKMYNDGTLYPAIAKANPGVQTRNMKIGHKLRVPPIDEARKMVAGGAAEDRPAVPSGGVAPLRDEPAPVPVTPPLDRPVRPVTPVESSDGSRPDFGG
ncbi:MAG: LysM peptidoglycan-binding domain-containing protein [Planctomycetaceae bacterium]|nr:LysM peptidoglycan-binding domain-containing protein [Planctomycetaceae bacterium]